MVYEDGRSGFMEAWARSGTRETSVRYLKVSVRNLDKEIKVRPSANLREVLLGAKLTIYPKTLGMQWLGNSKLPILGNCGGHGICGKCNVRVVDNPAGLSDRTKSEEKFLRSASPQARLACQAQVCGDVTVDVRKTSLNSATALLDEADAARQNHDKIVGAV